MIIQQKGRAASWLERSVILLALLYLVSHTLPNAWKTLNTDFPNYYLSASLVHDGFDTARMYEWPWIEREKDHRAVSLRIIGLLPITPFSTLAMLPLAKLTPLEAKHAWILLSLAALIPIAWMLRSMTGLSYQRVVLVFALCFPMHRNLDFGQYYIVLLFLIVAACWAHLRGFDKAAGILVAVAAACKIFPILFLILFLRRRAWSALCAAIATGIVISIASVAIFGWNVHLTYLREIIPWTLHGEAMPPYLPSASISAILHRLFLSEPQWNPRPWHSSPLCFSLLMPTIQNLILAPAILLIHKQDSSESRILLEWSALLTAALTISTVPALYNFVLLAFPVCVLMAALLRARRGGWTLVLLGLYLAIGLPLPSPEKLVGPVGFLQYIRLPLMLLLVAGICWLLCSGLFQGKNTKYKRIYAWSVLIAVATVFTVVGTFYREHSMREEFLYRLPLTQQGFLNEKPRSFAGEIRFIAFTYSGYRVIREDQRRIGASPSSLPDELSFTSNLDSSLHEQTLVEQSVSPHSLIVDKNASPQVIIQDARDPMLSADGQDLAFIRDNRGRGLLMMHSSFMQHGLSEIALAPPSLNVYEASFVSPVEYAFSATQDGSTPHIYITDEEHQNVQLDLGESRYPAISMDRRWMAYSHFEDGRWNLWLRNQKTGEKHRISNVPCNQIQPAWEEGSKSILYGTDCGRSLWFTAIARRQVVP